MMGMSAMEGMEGMDEMYAGSKEEMLKQLIQKMYKLMNDEADAAEMPMEEMAEAAEMPDESPAEMEYGEDDMPMDYPEEGGEMRGEMLDFMSGKKPPEKNEGMAVVVSSKLSGEKKKKGRGRPKKKKS